MLSFRLGKPFCNVTDFCSTTTRGYLMRWTWSWLFFLNINYLLRLFFFVVRVQKEVKMSSWGGEGHSWHEVRPLVLCFETHYCLKAGLRVYWRRRKEPEGCWSTEKVRTLDWRGQTLDPGHEVWCLILLKGDTGPKWRSMTLFLPGLTSQHHSQPSPLQPPLRNMESIFHGEKDALGWAEGDTTPLMDFSIMGPSELQETAGISRPFSAMTL